MLLTLKFKNYKMFAGEHEFNIDGNSFFLVGESETGKSTILEIINTLLMQCEFDDEALTAGQKDGYIYGKWDFGDGHIYEIRRRMSSTAKKSSLRFEVLNEHGKEESLKGLLEKLFGKAFKSQFNYMKYFYDSKTSEARIETFVKAIGGDAVLDNRKKINVRTTERHEVGGRRDTYANLLEQSNIDPETMEQDKVKYAAPKDFETHAKEYEPFAEVSAKIVDAKQIQSDLDIVEEQNEIFRGNELALEDINARIEQIRLELEKLENDKAATEQWMLDNPSDKPYEQELRDKLAVAAETNAELAPEYAKTYQEAKKYIDDFNQERFSFNNGLKYLEEFIKLNTKWDEIDQNITELKEANRQIFQERIPLPEISFEDDKIMYKCEDGVKREMCFPNISKGRSIRIAADIQAKLNPDGNKIILIPDAALMGGKFEDLAKELDGCHIQYVAEMTEPKKKFQIVMKEDYFNPPKRKK